MKHLFVVIPVYNAEKFIEQTVQSVLRKSMNVTIVLVDDGSRDASGEICDRLAAEIPCIHVVHKPNGGVSSARNVGIEFAIRHYVSEHDYIAFLDADDFWAEETDPAAYCSEDSDVYAFSTLRTDQDGKYRKIMHSHADETRLLPGANADWLCYGHFGSGMYRVDMLRRYDLRFMEGVTNNEDVIFWNQVNFCARKIIFISAPLYVYRVNPASVTHSRYCAMVVPSAWEAAKYWVNQQVCFTEEEKQRWIRKCSAVVGPALLEAAQTMAEQGNSAEQIQSAVLQGPLGEYITKLTPEKVNPSVRKSSFVYSGSGAGL